jgi:hypothetical protein
MGLPDTLILRPRLKFFRDLHPDAVAYLESIPAGDLAAKLAALIVQGLQVKHGLSPQLAAPLIDAVSVVARPSNSKNQMPTQKVNTPDAGLIESFGVPTGDESLFTYQ